MRSKNIRRFIAALLAAVLAMGFPALAEEAMDETQADITLVSYHVSGDVYRCGSYLYRVLTDGTAELVEYVNEDEITAVPDTIAGYPVTAIGPGAFSEQGDRNTTDDDFDYSLRRNIARLRIPEGITRIGDGAFAGCDSLMEVQLPDSLRSIGRGAFSDCPLLTHITLPEELESLGDYAFQGCEALYSLNLPAALQDIGANPFADCAHLIRLDVAENHPFLQYENGLLTDYRQNKLICCTKAAWAEGAQLPDGIEIIGESAFFAAPFVSIQLPDSVAAIESLAFSGCESLLDMTLPSSVARIGDNPFRGCSSLQSLRFVGEQTLFSLRDSALIDETENRLIAYLPLPMPLTEAETDTDTKSTADEEDFYCYGVKMKRIVEESHSWNWIDETGTGLYSVPEGIQSIAGSAFYDSCLQEILLPDSVQEIGPEAFAKCELLERCVLPAGITTIPNRLFLNCESLKSVSIPEGVTSIGAYAFDHCGVERLILPDSVETIGEYAFSYCRYLTEITLSQGIDNIPRGAFLRCYNLDSLTLPESVTEIGSEAFSYCGIHALVLPERLTAIPDWCFYCCRINEINLPPSVAYIGNYAFSGNGYNSSGVETIRFDQALQYIGDYAFWYAELLSGALLLPDSVTYLGVYSFKSCDQLKKAAFGAGLKVIPSNAFQGSGLTEAILPEGLIEIGECAFSRCKMTEIEVPQSVARIGKAAFYGCDNLEKAILPGGSVQIDGNPFGRCGVLKEIQISPNHPDLVMEEGFLIDRTERRLICPLRVQEIYQIPDGIEIIGDSAFIYQDTLKGVLFPQSLLRIEDDAFSDCESLKTLFLPDGLQWIGDRAFLDCELDQLILPDSLQWIGDEAFHRYSPYYAKGCHTLVLSAGLKRIGAKAFYGWRLDRLVLPESLEWIGNEAFSCEQSVLSQVVFPNNAIILDGNPFFGQHPQIELPEDHPTLELADGNLYSRTKPKLIAQFTDAPIREGTEEIGPFALAIRDRMIILPESVTKISALNRTWGYSIWYADCLYVVPDSFSEAYFETVRRYHVPLR